MLTLQIPVFVFENASDTDDDTLNDFTAKTRSLVVGFSILHNIQEQLTNNPDNAFNGSGHSLVPWVDVGH